METHPEAQAYGHTNIEANVDRMRRLATVELQLIMHFTDRCSLLKLARCSRYILATAQDKFAVKYMPAVEVNLSAHLPSSVVCRTLLRHAPMDICWSVANDSPYPTEHGIFQLSDAENIGSVAKMRSLQLFGTNMNPECVPQLLSRLTPCLQQSGGTRSLQELNIRGQQNSLIWTAVACLLNSCTQMHTARFHNNRIGVGGMQILAPVLRSHPSLTVLSLENNQLCDASIGVLADALRNSQSSVTQLSLFCNWDIGNAGALALAEMLPSTRAMRIVDVRRNEVTEDVKAEITRTLKFKGRGVMVL
jgi:hypothetical protein